ncbi:CHY zinc finger protein [Oceanobacillus iheyensis]|uniref:CHY zinc finger protein n=1 Tax=Oceanobacillus iheyensis TaxID=182710 RepID=UPI00363F8309
MIKVYGKVVDDQSRCEHYHSEKDIISIKFKCCNTYYPCYKCHQECENHEIERWQKEDFDEKAILCGACQTELTINEYMNVSSCKNCHASFNGNCQLHYHLYFDYN